ncbi:FUSC family protein [Cryobacterium sp. TMT1-3]|uniref:FUSC family protein n=1 Tax=Cryobacterium luteum TaxID=1424661 RepID=A0A1H8KPK6_9MICO|nr:MULTISPECIES: FUSC family protein [Cryobacterium]TFB95064.1 FUSC family protein [Cryobacterium luteum]TFC27284.1 FUSC family protein [Cryobacterium sp. TMT1-3]SEN94556.1 Fusaric acid resistance protein-like [Cryobacterium luteum]
MPRTRQARKWVTEQLMRPRALQVAKICIAVAIAWSLAPLMPGTAKEFPYYAPLGALLSMHPTLMRSVRSAAQTLAGVVIGVGLAGIVLLVSEPNVWTLSFVVGLGTLIGGMRWMGVGGEYVPITALFVLIIGGPDADGYSIGYATQLCLGIVVGLAVNLLILPPLAIGPARKRLTSFRRTLAAHLTEIGNALTASWPPGSDDWASQGTTLNAAARQVRTAVQTADESRKGNPRAWFHRANLDTDYDALVALENVTFHIRNLTEVLAGMVWGKPIPLDLPPKLRPVLSEALHAVAAAVTAEADRQLLDRADAAVEAILSAMQHEIGAGAATLSPTAAIVIDLKRILVALGPKADREEAVASASAPLG